MNGFRCIDKDTHIGEYTFIGKYTCITKSKIGRYCSIGTNVLIGPGEHDLTNISTSALFYEKPYNTLVKGEVIIGNDVWIGSYSIILRGITIGDGAVIAAGAVVTKNVPDFAIVAGIPAKIMRYRFSEDKQKKIKNSKWWDYKVPKAKEIFNRIK